MDDFENEEYEEGYEKEKEVKILLKRVGLNPEVMMIPNTLEDKQRLVNGYIENVYIDDLDVDLICNEEGKLLNMKPNLLFPYDYIAGDCFFIGDDINHGEYKSLTDEQIQKIKEYIKDISVKYPFSPIENEEKYDEEMER